MNKIDKLKKLIAEARVKDDFSWLPQTRIEEMFLFVCNENKTIPRKSVIDIYSVRASINETRGNPIKGFEGLLKNLDSTKIERVTIHRMTEQSVYEYLLFTDTNIEELFGVLQLVK